MKKKILIVLASLITVAFAACGTAKPEKPSGMSEKTFEAGLEAVDIIDSYYAGKLSDDDAADELMSVVDVMNGYSFTSALLTNKNNQVKADIIGCSWNMGYGDDEERLASEYNDLKRLLGYQVEDE